MEYEKQLETEMWYSKRYHILSLRGKQCMYCGSKNNLNIHHIKYTGMAWEAPDDDLICLCSNCHSKVHDVYDNSLTNDLCRKLIIDFNDRVVRLENAHIDFINYIKIDSKYLEKDLKLFIKELSTKYNVDINIKSFNGAYCEALDKSLFFNKIKIGRSVGYTIEYLE